MKNCNSLVLTLAVFIVACTALTNRNMAQTENESVSNDVAKQELLSFEVMVADAKGNPIVGAKLNPWAILSASGHGSWPVLRTGGLEPEVVTTDEEGQATVKYPKFTDVNEQIKSTAITISIDHPDHPFVSHENVPVPTSSVYKAVLPPGAAINVRVTLDGEIAERNGLYVLGTGGRSGKINFTTNDDQTYRIPPIKNGDAEFMFIKMQDKRVTHFSPIVKTHISSNDGPTNESTELQPLVRVQGQLSENVPRPVKNGRVKVTNIGDGKSWNGVDWVDWSAVEEDGTFAFDWIPDEPVQLIALCEGFIASNGDPPPMVSPERARGGYLRPQVFLNPNEVPIDVQMSPLETVSIQVENAFGKKLDEVRVAANPNVGWWNGGSQIYCDPLIKSATIISTENFNWSKFRQTQLQKGIYQFPFQAASNSDGLLQIALPAGRTHLAIGNGKFQMAARMGRRSRAINVESGGSNEFNFVLQPKGLDVLGDWEDLCGLVFG